MIGDKAACIKFLVDAPEKDYEVEEWHKKRSLSANALYWVCIGDIARHLGNTNARQHNLMLRKYGTPEVVDGCGVFTTLPDTDTAEETALEMESAHLRPTSEIKFGSDGSRWRWYQMLKGSSSYNTQEMSRLIDGVRTEMESMGLVFPDRKFDEAIKRLEKHDKADRRKEEGKGKQEQGRKR